MHTVEVRLGQMGIITLTVCLHIVHFAREVLKQTKRCPVDFTVSAHYLTTINMAQRVKTISSIKVKYQLIY